MVNVFFYSVIGNYTSCNLNKGSFIISSKAEHSVLGVKLWIFPERLVTVDNGNGLMMEISYISKALEVTTTWYLEEPYVQKIIELEEEPMEG